MNFHSQRFGRAARTYAAHAEVQARMADTLLELLPKSWESLETPSDPHQGNPPPTILELGCGTGILTKQLSMRFPDSTMWITDASAQMLEAAHAEMAAADDAQAKIHFSILDATGVQSQEQIAPGTRRGFGPELGFELAASNALVQWFPDLAMHLRMVKNLLAPQGQYLVSGFSNTNFPELNALLREPPFAYRDFPGHQQSAVAAAASAAGLEILAFKEEAMELIYPSAETFLAVISGLGSSRRPGHAPLTQSKLIFLVEQYRGRYSCLGGVKATWKPWYALMKKTKP